MDLSQLSSADLVAIQKGDMSSVSSAGLKAIAGNGAPAKSSPPINPATADYGSTLQFGPIDTHIPIGTGLQNFLAGMGKAPADLARGTGQMLGLTSRQDVSDSRAVDAPLMATGAGKVGNLAGNVAQLLPAAFIPGANTLAGAGAIGAGLGLLQPSASTGETLLNTGLGGALGPAGLLLGRGAGALYQGGKAALEPLFAGGQHRIAGRTLQAFAGTPQEAATAASNLTSAPSVLPGVQPTTAELANNAGISQLARVLKNNPEYATTLVNREASNRFAMAQALSGIAGTDSDMAAAQAARTNAVSALYDSAGKASVPLDNQMTALLQRPSMQTAISRAQSLAAENGDTFGLTATMRYLPTQLSGKDLQYLKMSMNDIANSGSQMGMGAHEIGAVKSTLGDLNGWIANNVPALKAADAAFATLSKPINQMQIGQQLSNKLVPALGDFGGNAPLPALRASQFATALRNGDRLAANATGWKGSTLANILSPDQMQTLNQVGEQLARTANANATNVVGSNTGQNLVGQNVLRQLLGPLGLPQSMGERVAASTFGQQITRPLKFIAGFGEDNIRNQLANAMLDPQVAGGLLRMQSNPAVARALWARQGLLGPISIGVGNSLMYPADR